MARQVLPLAGALVGNFFGSPQLGFAIGSIIGNIVDPQRIKGPRLDEVPVQTANEGGYRQVVYGTCWINTTNIIDFGDVDRVIVEERQGKGGGPIVESERLYRTYAIGLGEPLEAIRVIRKDGKIVYDVRPGSTILEESAKFAERFRFYTGSETQLPDPDLEALPRNGVGNTPSHRGTAYLVFPRDDLTDRQGSISTYEVEAVRVIGGAVQDVTAVTNDRHYSGPATDLARAGASVGWGSAINVVRVSPNGIYAAGSVINSLAADRFELRKYDPTSGTWSALSLPAHVPTRGPIGMAWSPDSLTLAVSTTNIAADQSLILYSRSGDTLTKIADPVDPIPAPAGGQRAVTWNDAGDKLLCGAGASDKAMYVWEFIAGALVNRKGFIGTGTNVVGGPGSAHFMAGTGRYIACGSMSHGYVVRFDQTNLEVVASTTDDNQDAASFNATGTHIVGVKAQTINVYAFDGTAGAESMTLVSTQAVAPTTNTDSRFTANRRYMALARAGTFLVYDLGASGEPPMTLVETAATPGDLVDSISWVGTPDVPQYDATAVVLADLVADIADRCGLPASKIDVTQLTDEVQGITLGGPYNGAGAITTLMPAYLFDLFDADKKLRFPKRGAAVVATITDADLIDEPDENTLRGQDIEYPRSLLLKYLNPGQNYAAPAAVVRRTSPDIRVSGEASTDLPISLDETQALNVAERMLKVMWEDLNGEAVLSLPAGPFAWLTPSDNLGLSLRGAVYRIRVEQAETAGGILKLTARRDRQSAYTSNLTAIPLPAPTPPPPSLAGATQFVVLNIPGIVDGDDPLLGIRVGVSGLAGFAWSGCSVRLSSDAGVTWDTVATITTRARIGNLLAALPAASPHYTDTTNSLNVLMLDDRDLEAVTQAQFLSEGNGAAIARDDGSAELIQFRDVTDEGANEWTLETLLRGRLNTSPAAHLAGAKFVMLDGTVFLPLASSLIGQPLVLQFVSAGTSPEVAPTFAFTWNPALSQTEFQPVDVRIKRELGVISGTWIPRHRFGNDVTPIVSVNFAGWRVVITDGTTTNTFDTTEPTFAVSDAVYAGNVTVTVASINRITTGIVPSVPVAPPVVPPGPVFTLTNADFEAGASGWTGLAANTATFTIINDPAEAYQGGWCGRLVGDLAVADPQYVFNNVRPIQEANGTAAIYVRFAPLITQVLVAVEVRVCVQVVDVFDVVVREQFGLGYTTNTISNGLEYQWMRAEVSSLVTIGEAETVRIGVRVRSIYATNGPPSTGTYTLYIDAAGFNYGT